MPRHTWIPTVAWVGAMAVLTPPALAQARGWEVIWSDEFDGTGLDRDVWEPQVGDGTGYGLPSGWGNRELQWYRDDARNIEVADGTLRIIALDDGHLADSGKVFGYTSARLRTRGLRDFKYGRIEGRIRFPSSPGMWVAFWLMPTDDAYGGWAASGELDIMESKGVGDKIFGSMHFGGEWPANRVGTRWIPGMPD